MVRHYVAVLFFVLVMSIGAACRVNAENFYSADNEINNFSIESNGGLFQQNRREAAEIDNWKKQINGYTLVITECKDYEEAATGQDYIKKLGGSIAVIGSKNAWLGWIDPKLTDQLVDRYGITAIYYKPVDIVTLKTTDRPTLQTVAFFNSVVNGSLERQLLNENTAQPVKKDHFDGLPHPKISYDDYLKNLENKNLDIKNLQNENRLLKVSADGVSGSGNSEKMIGTVTVAMFLVESNGAADQNLYTWSSADEDSMYQRTLRNLSWWSGTARTYGKSVSFNIIPHYHSESVCQQPYEPIIHSSREDSLWIGSIMKNAGFQNGTHHSRVESYNTWLRSTYHTDWAYTIFFAYNRSPAPHSFTNGYGGYAYMGGPYTQILFDWFPSGTPTLTHETGHIFWAPDEYYIAGYGGCGDGATGTKSGFINGNCEVSNMNSVDCMMRRNSYALCAYTPAHIGWTNEVQHYFLMTKPAGLYVLAQCYTYIPGVQQKSPQDFPWGPGLKVKISVVSPQVINGKRYEFQSWSDGGAQSHDIIVTGNSTDYIANFIQVGESPQTWSVFQKSKGIPPAKDVKSVATDLKGNIWVGSQIGLSKYDGESWTTYSTYNSAIPANSIKFVTTDMQGNVWILFYPYYDGNAWIDTGIAKFDGTSWEVYNKSNSGLPSNEVQTIAVDKSGNKWIGTLDAGMAKFNGSTWTVYNTSNSRLPNNNVVSIALDSLGNKWIGTANELVKYDDTNWTIYNVKNSGLPDNYVSAVSIDEQGNKWIGTIRGLAKFDDNNWTIYNSGQFSKLKNISSITIDAEGNKWIGTWFGLFKFAGSSIQEFSISNSGLPADWVNSITMDGSGNKLIATTGGFVKYDGIKWQSFPSSGNNLPHNYVKAVAIDDAGNKWIGTGGGGLVKFDGNRWTVFNDSNSPIPNNNISAISCDRDGNAWIGAGTGLAKFDGTNWTVYTSSNSGLPNNWVWSIAIDGAGNKWIGTFNGIVKFDGTNWTAFKDINPGLSINVITCIAIDGVGNVWAGILDGGLFKFDGTNWTSYNMTNSGLPNNSICSIAFDGLGVKWIGTDKGLVRFDGINWTIYNTSNSSLPYNSVRSITIDAAGTKWVGTGSGSYGGGLVKIDGTRWTVYNSSNSGLPYNSITRVAIDALGSKWIGTESGGLAVFNDGGLPFVCIPSRPQLLLPVNGTDEQSKNIMLKWKDVKNAKKYFVNFSSDPMFNNKLRSDSTVLDTTRIYSNLREGEKYYWKICVKNAMGISPWSDAWNFITKITSPTNLTLERTALKEVTLRWNDNSNNEKGYVIERKQSSQSNYSFLDSLKTTVTAYKDKNVEQGQNYYYRIKAYTERAQSSYSNEINMNLVGIDKNNIPAEYSLSQNYPNPFNPATKIKFSLPEKSITNLIIYDVLGREVKVLIDCELNAGYHEIQFNASQLSSGVYLYRIVTPKFTSTRKLVLLK